MKSAFSLMTFSFAVVAIWHCRLELHSRFRKGTITFLKDFIPFLLLNGFCYFVISQKLANLIKSRYLEPRRRVQIITVLLQKKQRFLVLLSKVYHQVLLSYVRFFTPLFQALAVFGCWWHFMWSRGHGLCRLASQLGGKHPQEGSPSLSTCMYLVHKTHALEHRLSSAGHIIVSSGISVSYIFCKRLCFKNWLWSDIEAEGEFFCCLHSCCLQMLMLSRAKIHNA